MKKFSWFVAMLLVTCMIFLVYGCKEQELPSSNEGDTSSLTLDFNGGKLFGNSSVKFSCEEIEDLVGTPIELALSYLDFGIDRLEKGESDFLGWTLKKNGENYVRYLPEYGILYAKWDNGTSSEPNAPLSVTLDFNGGTYEGESSLTLTAEELEMYVGMDITLAINNLRVFTTSFPSKNDGSTFIGFAATRNGTPGEPWTIPESGSHTLYAIYMQI